MTCADDRYLLVYETAVDLLACVAETVRHTSGGIGKDMRVFVSPGIPTDDDCCDGQLAVYVVSMYPSRSFPAQDLLPMNCGSPYTAVIFGVRITRCIPVVTVRGGEPVAPTPAVLQAAAAGMYEDAYAIWWGARCCMNEWAQRVANPLDGVLGAHSFFEPMGACVGSELQLTIGLTDGCGCE